MRRLACILILGLMTASAHGQTAAWSRVDRVVAWMDSLRYDSAQALLNVGFAELRRKPNQEMAFYLNAFQSEVFYHNALLELGTQYALKGLQLAEALADSTMQANQHNLLGLLYTDLGEDELAVNHLNRSLALLPAKPISRNGLTMRHHILANIGQYYMRQGRYAEAQPYNLQSYQEADWKCSYRGMAIGAWCYAECREALGFPNEALHWAKQSLQHAQTGQDPDIALLIYTTLYRLTSRNHPAQAQAYLAEAENLAREHPYRITAYSRRQAAEQLTGIYYRLGEYKKAADLYGWLTGLNKKLGQMESDQRMSMLRAYYENEQAQIRRQDREKAHAAELRQNRRIALAAIAGSLALAIGAGVIAYSWRQRARLKGLLAGQRIHALEQGQQLARLRGIMMGEERERTRIARELHDGLSGLLAAARYQVEGNLRAAGIPAPEPLDLLDQASQEVRRIAHNLMPVALQRQGLAAALREHARNLTGTSGPRVTFRQTGPEPTLSATQSLWLYRSAQELVANAIRHGRAGRIGVRLANSGASLTLSVTDDGIGFPQERGSLRQGSGLAGIRARARRMGGRFGLKVTRSGQTRLILRIPLSNPGPA